MERRSAVDGGYGSASSRVIGQVAFESIDERADGGDERRIEALLQVFRFVTAELRFMECTRPGADGGTNGLQDARVEGGQRLYRSHLYRVRFAGSVNQEMVSPRPRRKPSLPW